MRQAHTFTQKYTHAGNAKSFLFHDNDIAAGVYISSNIHYIDDIFLNMQAQAFARNATSSSAITFLPVCWAIKIQHNILYESLSYFVSFSSRWHDVCLFIKKTELKFTYSPFGLNNHLIHCQNHFIFDGLAYLSVPKHCVRVKEIHKVTRGRFHEEKEEEDLPISMLFNNGFSLRHLTEQIWNY